jgi:hypothetical protein
MLCMARAACRRLALVVFLSPDVPQARACPTVELLRTLRLDAPLPLMAVASGRKRPELSQQT